MDQDLRKRFDAPAEAGASSTTHAKLPAEGVALHRWLVDAEEAGVRFDLPTVH
jgi:hypothetical protein